MTTRRQFVQGTFGSLFLAGLGRAVPSRSSRPNLLLVIADEWRADALGYAGDPNAHTPVIDRLAAQSVNFERAVSGCPTCSPSRASLMTGQYPLTHGVYLCDVPLAPKGITLGEALRNAGYQTGYIGKWHLDGSPDGRYERREAYIPPEKRFGFDYWKAQECTHDYNHSSYYEGNDQTKKYWPGYDAIAQTEDACRYVREHAKSPVPYFLMLSCGPPHPPLHTAPERYQAMYRDREIRLRPNVPEDRKTQAIEDLRGYYAHIAALDECFGRLLDTLEATGSAEDTIVVFTSDHGNMRHSQGVNGQLCPWEECIRIPLLIRIPRKFGRTARRSAALPIGMPDLMPTLLGLCGIPVPPGVQGTDYYSSPTPTTRTAAPVSSAFLSLPVPNSDARTPGFAEYRGIRSLQYTYVRSIYGPWLLYDNQRDPYQMHNLCGRPEAKAIQARLDIELSGWLDTLNDQFLPAMDYLRRDHLSHYLETKFPVGYTRSPWGDWESTLPKPVLRLSVDSALGDLLDSPDARRILSKELPDLIDSLEKRDDFSLRLLEEFGGGQISKEKLQFIEEQLARLPWTDTWGDVGNH